MIREHYSHKIADAEGIHRQRRDEKKKRKHKEADERLQARKQRSNEQQLAKLDKEERMFFTRQRKVIHIGVNKCVTTFIFSVIKLMAIWIYVS